MLVAVQLRMNLRGRWIQIEHVFLNSDLAAPPNPVFVNCTMEDAMANESQLTRT